MTEPTKIAVCGDWHGNLGWARCAIAYAVTEKGADHLVHVGDFGFWIKPLQQGSATWDYLRKIQQTLESVDSHLWWLDGNHEHHPTLEALVAKYGTDAPIPMIDNDGREFDRIHYLPRGYQWEWWGKRFMAVGGAFSIDRYLRKENEGWWAGELLTPEQVEEIVAKPPADVVFSHDCPRGVNIPGIGPDSKPRGGENMWPDAMLYGAQQHRIKLREIWEAHQAKVWLHGHYHRAYELWYRNTRFIGLDCDGAKGMWLNVDILTPEDLD